MKYFIQMVLPEEKESRSGFAEKEFVVLDHVPPEGSYIDVERKPNGTWMMGQALNQPDYDLINGKVTIYCVLCGEDDTSAFTEEKGWNLNCC